MKIKANLGEIERLVRKCAYIQNANSYAPCANCVLEDFCLSNDEMHKLIEYNVVSGGEMDEEVALSENTEECSSRIWINDGDHGKG